MGLFDFVAEAGEKLTDKVLGDTSGTGITEKAEISADRIDKLREESINNSLAALDIDGEQVSVQVNGDSATLTGSAPSQEALEKMVLCAGNQHGIAQVDCQLQVDAPPAPSAASGSAPAAAQVEAEPAAPAAESNFYTVQSGDTLGKIAQQHYGAANKYTIIFEANKPMLTDPDKIYPGQKLRIPAL
jgi:nucleoid-associated protein YgaU